MDPILVGAEKEAAMPKVIPRAITGAPAERGAWFWLREDAEDLAIAGLSSVGISFS